MSFSTLKNISKGHLPCDMKLRVRCVNQSERSARGSALRSIRATDPLQGEWRADARLSRESCIHNKNVNNSFLTESSVLNTGFSCVRSTSQSITFASSLLNSCDDKVDSTTFSLLAQTVFQMTVSEDSIDSIVLKCRNDS